MSENGSSGRPLGDGQKDNAKMMESVWPKEVGGDTHELAPLGDGLDEGDGFTFDAEKARVRAEVVILRRDHQDSPDTPRVTSTELAMAHDVLDLLRLTSTPTSNAASLHFPRAERMLDEEATIGADEDASIEVMVCDHCFHLVYPEGLDDYCDPDVLWPCPTARATSNASGEGERVIEAARVFNESCWEGAGGDRDYNDAHKRDLENALAAYDRATPTPETETTLMAASSPQKMVDPYGPTTSGGEGE